MRDRGFTLMEVMISLGIVAVLAALVWGAFGPTWQAKQFVEEEANRYHSIRLAMERMTREISMAFLSDHFDHRRYRDRPTHFVGEDSGTDDTLRFTTMAHERLYQDAKESEQSLVAYRVGRDPDDRDRNVLFRREKTVIDDRPDDGGVESILAADVLGMNLEYWDVAAQEWKDEWNTNDTEHKNLLPERVRITLIVKGDDGKERRFSTQAMIAINTPLGS
jgi:general secretion pathway protein J